jgi:hypothetical protein
MTMLAPEEENDAEVRKEDQDRINRFARLNAQLHEVRRELGEVKVSCCIYSSVAWFLLDNT